MTTSPKGYPFERIEYDEGQMNSLHGHLEDAADEVSSMQLVLRNVTEHREHHRDGEPADDTGRIRKR